MKAISKGEEENWAREWSVSIDSYANGEKAKTTFKLSKSLITQAQDEFAEKLSFVCLKFRKPYFKTLWLPKAWFNTT